MIMTPHQLPRLPRGHDTSHMAGTAPAVFNPECPVLEERVPAPCCGFLLISGRLDHGGEAWGVAEVCPIPQNITTPFQREGWKQSRGAELGGFDENSLNLLEFPHLCPSLGVTVATWISVYMSPCPP